MASIEPIRRATTGPEAWEPCITSDGRTLGMAKWKRPHEANPKRLRKVDLKTLGWVSGGRDQRNVYAGRSGEHAAEVQPDKAPRAGRRWFPF